MKQVVSEEMITAELHAVVRGECPRLLDEDSGGSATLGIEIEDLLARSALTPSAVGGGEMEGDSRSSSVARAEVAASSGVKSESDGGH